MNHDAIAIAGTGRMAQALGRLLASHGWTVAAIAGRRREQAEAAARFVGGAAVVEFGELSRYAPNVLLCVADDAIDTVARAIGTADIAIHTSGLHDTAPLAPLGCASAAMHPLQTVASPEQGMDALPRAWFGVSGDAAACWLAGRLVESIGARCFAVEGNKRALYHASAVMASNAVIALMDAAVILMKRAGVPEAEARQALAPLVTASVDNALRMGTESALTGPIRRGDRGTIVAHRKALAAFEPGLQKLYGELGRHTLGLAVRAGLPPEAAEQLEMILSDEWNEESHG